MDKAKRIAQLDEMISDAVAELRIIRARMDTAHEYDDVGRLQVEEAEQERLIAGMWAERDHWDPPPSAVSADAERDED